jgi:hypothetical protein
MTQVCQTFFFGFSYSVTKARWAGHVARIGLIWNAYVFVGKPEEKTSPETPRRRSENNIEMDLKETGC